MHLPGLVSSRSAEGLAAPLQLPAADAGWRWAPCGELGLVCAHGRTPAKRGNRRWQVARCQTEERGVRPRGGRGRGCCRRSGGASGRVKWEEARRPGRGAERKQEMGGARRWSWARRRSWNTPALWAGMSRGDCWYGMRYRKMTRREDWRGRPPTHSLALVPPWRTKRTRRNAEGWRWWRWWKSERKSLKAKRWKMKSAMSCRGGNQCAEVMVGANGGRGR